jgi:Ca2+-binding RTX toxin-like protein
MPYRPETPDTTITSDPLTETSNGVPVGYTSRIEMVENNPQSPSIYHLTIADGVRVEALGASSNAITSYVESFVSLYGRLTSTQTGIQFRTSGTLSIGATGSITAGTGVIKDIGGSSVTNNGTINATNGYGILAADGTSIINNHVIDASGVGIAVRGQSNNHLISHVTNTGSITATIGVQIGDINSQITNTGSITSTQIGIELLAPEDGSSYSVNNLGLISGAIAIKGSQATDIVTNAGIISGEVNLGGGDDVFDNSAGTVMGIIRLDGDSDADPSNDPAGDDVMYGNIKSENVDAGGGDNLVDTGGGNDTIAAGSGSDELIGGAGRDLINAGHGNNTLEGGIGNDTLSAGRGNDIFDGGEGIDTVRLSGDYMIVDLRKTSAQATGLGSDRFIGIENIIAEGGQAFFIGNPVG